MMNFVAWIHTEGVILGNRYYVLELAYEDIIGFKKVFLVKSPKSYTRAQKENKYLHKSLEVVMCRQKFYRNHQVYLYSEVVRFLQNRYRFLKHFYLKKTVYFGYKGMSFQKDILKNASIPSINFENVFNIPSIAKLMIQLPYVKRKKCVFHKSINNKCASYILDLIHTYCVSQNFNFVL